MKKNAAVTAYVGRIGTWQDETERLRCILLDHCLGEQLVESDPHGHGSLRGPVRLCILPRELGVGRDAASTFQASLLGVTSGFVFPYDPETEGVAIIPLENLASLALK